MGRGLAGACGTATGALLADAAGADGVGTAGGTEATVLAAGVAGFADGAAAAGFASGTSVAGCGDGAAFAGCAGVVTAGIVDGTPEGATTGVAEGGEARPEETGAAGLGGSIFGSSIFVRGAFEGSAFTGSDFSSSAFAEDFSGAVRPEFRDVAAVLSDMGCSIWWSAEDVGRSPRPPAEVVSLALIGIVPSDRGYHPRRDHIDDARRALHRTMFPSAGAVRSAIATARYAQGDQRSARF